LRFWHHDDVISGYSRHPIATVRRDRLTPARAALDPVIVAVLASVVSLAGAGRPSFWYDEAATISAAYSRSLSQLWHMLGNVDAVEGLYYVLMHGWFKIVPPTEFWSRVPSGLAVGAAAAGVVVLGKQFSSRTVALASGVVCAILPRATWAGIEARPYALSMMAAVWLTVLFIRATRRDDVWVWVCYGLVLAMSALLDVYLLLLSPAYVAFICAFRRTRTVVLRFALASVLAGCALIVATAIVLWLFTSARLVDADRQLLTLAIGWLVIPTAVIVAWSAVVHPVYTPRYLCFTAPAMALVLGVCVGALAVTRWAATAVVCLLAVAAAPSYVSAQRNPYAKYGMDYSQVADLIAARAAPGDCLLVNDTVTFMPAPMRPLLAARPDAYRKLVDLTLWQRATDRNDVFDTNLIPEVVAKPLSQCRVVWIITQADEAMPAREQGSALPPGPLYGATPAFAVPHDLGFHLVERWQFNLVQVVKAVR
jgi:mannosyltransferase